MSYWPFVVLDRHIVHPLILGFLNLSGARTKRDSAFYMFAYKRTKCVCVAQAGQKAGLSSSEVDELLSLAKSQPIKEKLKLTTQEALDYKASIQSSYWSLKSSLCSLILISLSLQAFGFPLVVCHVEGKPEVFFGSDRFELMAYCIGTYNLHSEITSILL